MDKETMTQLNINYQPCGKRSQGRPLNRFLDCQWNQNKSRGLKSCRLYDQLRLHHPVVFCDNFYILGMLYRRGPAIAVPFELFREVHDLKFCPLESHLEFWERQEGTVS
jgi:hypothetical protein